jgi:anti-anti-sigma factor
MRCEGKIVRGQEDVLRNAVLQERLARVIVVDLADVESIDCGGLNLLLYLHRWTQGNEAHLKLVNACPFVHEMLTRTHLDRVFEIFSGHRDEEHSFEWV